MKDVHLRSFVASIALLACDATPATSPPDASEDAGEDAGTDASAPFVSAPHDLPLPIPFGGGPVLANASIVVVTFAEYTYSDDVEAMADWVGGSKWLASVGSEYGVSSTSVLAKVRLPTAAPSFTSAADFTQWVIDQVGTTLPSPPSSSTFYAVIFPSGESFSDPDIGAMCQTFGGYHDAVASLYAFAAIGTCPNDAPGLTDLEQVERIFSHELIEALTDPFGTGYASRDPSDAWSFVGGEVADDCDHGFFHEDGFLAVRSWSNAAAAQDLDPCQPNDVVVPYFDVTLPEVVQNVNPGDTRTFTVTGYSNAPTADWTMSLYAGHESFKPTITFAPGAMNNGTTATLTVGIPSDATGSATLLFHSFQNGSSYSLAPLVFSVGE